MIKGFSLVVLCACLLHGSENASPNQLFEFSASLDGTSASIAWYKNARRGDYRGAKLLLNTSSKNLHWMSQLATLSVEFPLFAGSQSEYQQIKQYKAEAAYMAAVLNTNRRQRIHWFGIAAKLDHPQSQFELSLLLDTDAKARLALLKQSAENGHRPAILTIADFYHKSLINIRERDRVNNDTDASNLSIQYIGAQHLNEQSINDRREALQKNTLYWLEQSSHFDSESAFELGGLYWQSGKVEQASSAFTRAYSLGAKQARNYLSAIEVGVTQDIHALFETQNAYKHEEAFGKARNTDNHKLTTRNKCSQQLQFVATSLHTKVHAQYIKKRFEADERFSNLPICINQVAWLDESAMECNDVGPNIRVQCDLSALAKIKQSPSFTHLVVFADSGRAYVQRGVMYLDRFDEYSVFVHELAHFAGFVDEYALSAQMANIHCKSVNAPNLMTKNSDGELNTDKMAYWEGLSQSSVTISQSRTCEHAAQESFKPSADITFLEHHDIEYIPEIYKRLWQKQLEKQNGRVLVSEEFVYLSRIGFDDASAAHWRSINLL